MAEVEVDYQALREQFRRTADSERALYDAHQARKPAFPVPSTGQGFGHYGRQIATIFDDIHRQGARRIARREHAADFGVEECTRFGNCDHAGAQALGRYL